MILNLHYRLLMDNYCSSNYYILSMYEKKELKLLILSENVDLSKHFVFF